MAGRNRCWLYYEPIFKEGPGMKPNLRYVCGVVSVLALSACSSGGGGSGDGGSASVANVSGKVTQSAGASSVYSKPMQKGDVSAAGAVGKFAESGCTIEAKDLTTNAVVATATSDSNGNYTLTGVTAGSTYKIVATCGSNVYTAVAGAVVSDPSSVSDADRVGTNPRSTVIAAYIVKAVLSAVSESTAGLPTSVQDAVRQTILQTLDSVIQTITSTIEEAINSGSMTEPTVAEATSVATTLKDATDTTAVNTAISAAPAAPVAVDQAVIGAKNSSAALQACNSSLGGSQAKCIVAVAKLTYNVLGFPVGIIKGGGAFGTSNDCSASTTVASGSGGGTLNDYFPNAKYADHAADTNIPSGYCAIKPKLAAPDRNRGYENDGESHSPVFVEEGDLDGDTVADTGVLTELGKALYNNTKYNIGSVDKMVFGSTNSAGFNARLISRQFVPGAGSGSYGYYYYGSGGSWVNTSWISTCQTDGRSPGSGSSPCSYRGLNLTYSSTAWSSASSAVSGAATLAGLIGAGDVTGLGIFAKIYGGTIPTQNELNTFIDQGRIHTDYNITGEKEIHVVTSTYPKWSGASNPCFDNDPTTACKDSDGAAIQPVRVNLTFGTADATTKVKPITAIATDASGEYYMRPYYNQNGFSGVLGFVKVSDGRIVRDELMRDRAVKIVFTTNDCNTNALPATGSGCAVDKMYNVELSWSGCNGGGGGTCPGYTATNSTAITKTGLTLAVQANYKASFEQWCGGSGCWGHNLVGKGTFGSLSYLKLKLTNVNADHDTFNTPGFGKATVAGEYNVAVNYSCTSSACTADDFYLVDKDGVPYTDDGGTLIASMGYPGGTWTSVGKYTLAEIDATNSGDLDTSTAGSQTLADLAANYNIPEGPIRNPNFSCDAEPFFIDGNGNGKLDCETVGGFSQASASSGDKSFQGTYEYSWYLNDPSIDNSTRTARQSQILRPRDNAYEYGDPLGTKKLMSIAFNGWFDGQHTLTSTQSLDAIQVFSLLYMFMSSGGDTKHIEGVVSNQNEFEVVSPLLGDGGGDVKSMNKAIGQAFIEYKTN